MTSTSRLALLLCSFALAPACSDDDPATTDGGVRADATATFADAAATSPDATATTSARKMIGPAGGELTLGGLTMTIPPSAVMTMTEISISIASQTAPPGYVAYTPVYAFEPHGLTLALPVRVALELSTGAIMPQLYWTTAGSMTEFELLGSTVVGNTLVGNVTHFSLGFGGRAASAGDAGVAEDATAASPDASSGFADAMPEMPDATSGFADAMPGSPDASSGFADALAGDPDAATGPVDSGVPECTSIVPGTRAVTQVAVAMDVPAPQGGTITPGTYVLVERTRYVGTGGQVQPQLGTYFQTMELGATSYDMTFRLEAPGGMVYGGETSGSWSSAGTSFVLDLVCPQARTTMIGYTASGNRFTQLPPGPTGEVSVFERQ